MKPLNDDDCESEVSFLGFERGQLYIHEQKGIFYKQSVNGESQQGTIMFTIFWDFLTKLYIHHKWKEASLLDQSFVIRK